MDEDAMSTPPLHAEVRAYIIGVLSRVQLQNVDAEGEAAIESGADAILQAVADALMAGLPKRRTWENVQYGKDTVPEARTKAINRREAMAFNEALDAVTRVIGELGGY